MSQQSAALLAQVLPVFILAAVIELRVFVRDWGIEQKDNVLKVMHGYLVSLLALSIVAMGAAEFYVLRLATPEPGARGADLFIFMGITAVTLFPVILLMAEAFRTRFGDRHAAIGMVFICLPIALYFVLMGVVTVT